MKFVEENQGSIKDFNFQPLDLVLVKNMIVEHSHSAKMLLCYHGPLVVITKTKGGNYIVAELDGSVWQKRVAAFRVVPYKACKQLSLSQSLEQWVDITPAKLNELKKELQKPSDNDTQDISFGTLRLHKPLDSELDIYGEKSEN